MIVTDGLPPDAVQLFSEAEVQKGSLGKLLGADKTKNGITGPTLLPKLVEIARSG